MNITQKFESFQKLVCKELPVRIANMEVTLNILNSREEIEAHVYASGFDKYSYLFSLKVATLSYAIVAIDGERLPARCPTGQTDPITGEDLLTERHIFVRNLLHTLPQHVIDTLFSMYSLLMEEVESDVTRTLRVKGKRVEFIDGVPNIEDNSDTQQKLDEELERSIQLQSRSQEEALREAGKVAKDVEEQAGETDKPIAQGMKRHHAGQQLIAQIKKEQKKEQQ